MVRLGQKQQICTCTPNLYTVCINAGLQCAVCTRAIHTNNTIIKNLFEKCVCKCVCCNLATRGRHHWWNMWLFNC